jgi:hypothetical protein
MDGVLGSDAVKALGLTIPRTVTTQAEELIE